MIEKQSGLQALLCDSCDEPLGESFSPDCFNDMISYAKAERWTIRQEDGSWRHYCAECEGPVESALDRQRRLFTR